MEPLVSVLHKEVNHFLIFLQLSVLLEQLEQLKEISIVRFDCDHGQHHNFFYYIIYLVESFKRFEVYAL